MPEYLPHPTGDIRDHPAFAAFTPEQFAQYERFVLALLELHAAMVACGKWPPSGVTTNPKDVRLDVQEL
jgi:hypothetical protein